MYLFVLICVLATGVWAQQAEPARGTAPIYRYQVTVEQRTVRALNYGTSSVPTRVGFRGTPYMPEAKGEAMVESRIGAVDVDSKFQNLAPPTRFGPQYLTYVLWAITPEGRPVNLGEIVANGANKAKLKTATQLQAFGLIVTAEPYYAVTAPSNIVVLENYVRPGTIGKVEEVEARYELMPRGDYPVDQAAAQSQAAAANASQPVAQDQYEAVLALYQALNAIQIARAQDADRWAPDVMQKAVQLYDKARTLEQSNIDNKTVVMMARESAQRAEDARQIAAHHK